jgi:CheY-like chemotaxis protein
MERQLRVMVLDTSKTSCKILEVILRREGHRVVCFADPLEALRFLSRYGPADLLFLGMDLPRMDGLEVLKFLREEVRFHSMVPIALLSERDGVLCRVKARLAGAQQVVTKPAGTAADRRTGINILPSRVRTISQGAQIDDSGEGTPPEEGMW